ncbi:MAG: ccsB [Paucimonas sp.]|nr:ccsB [Paucimonas sp.]
MELTGKQDYVMPTPFWRTLNWSDWAYAAALTIGALFALNRFADYMDIYEKGILLLSAPVFSWLGWRWKPIRPLMAGLAVLALGAIALYEGNLDMANKKFLLKYFLSSQSAILWMSALFLLSTLFYWGGLLSRSDFGASVGSKLCWGAVVLGFTGMLVRWYESYLIGADVGHIPVSNLYEVFILFSMITALFYLYYEHHYGTRQLGPFVLIIIAAAVGFLLWYTVSREASDIQPLVPALQSWWMKIHVPANFIGYGTFALASMVAWAYLLRNESKAALWVGLVGVPLGLLVFAWAVAGLSAVWAVDGVSPNILANLKTASWFAIGLAAMFSFSIALKHRIAARLPENTILDDVMYKAIAVGFAFFTIATILGALWAAEAWGGYWSWDPKETWALIVWLNYAAWLHMRLMKGLRGQMAAWWALVGLLVTTFAFLGVNMFLSGLHSYGEL